MVCRTGYTGERGYELIADNEVAPALWDALLAAGEPHGILPCGLGARDTLRTEMGYPLHGQDISLDVTPVQARLGWAVGWSKPEFWGKERAGRGEGGRRPGHAAGPGRPGPRHRPAADEREGDPGPAGRLRHLRHVLADLAQGRSPWR